MTPPLPLSEKPRFANDEQASFWDRRYSAEGAIWGEEPSPTARLVSERAALGTRVLDVGFGYGRDMAYLIKCGLDVSGVDLSWEGRKQAESRFHRAGVRARALRVAAYAEDVFPPESFDVIFSHRMAHLLTSEADVRQYAFVTSRLLRPGGLVCVGARDVRDLEPEAMVAVGLGIYEYKHRPGHRIRYWDESSFHQAFGDAFEILSLTPTMEPECVHRPVPCQLTLMTARKL